MNRKKNLYLLGEKGQDYQLIVKVADIISTLQGKDIQLEDLIAIESFNKAEKKRLRNIFHKNICTIYAWNFMFRYEDGIVSQRDSTHDYQHDVKSLIILLNEKEFSVGVTVSTSDLNLIKILLQKWNQSFEDEWRQDRGDEPPPFYINKDVLYFISNDLKQRLGEYSTFDFNFVKEFRGAFSDYMDMSMEMLIKGLTPPHKGIKPQILRQSK